jgi:uncharacterized protein YbcC (UPF0753/DUF2309 family)
LKVGLPWQSVHDGQRFVHEPLRLNVFIEAPLAAINEVIAKHAPVRELVDNRWLHLFALAERGLVSHRYRGQMQWQELSAAGASRPAMPESGDRAGAEVSVPAPE